jgi:anti-sigma-K factor RskA
MVGKKNSRISDEGLDRVGLELIRASATNTDEAETVAASPFLYARLRSRINSEREQRVAKESWVRMLSVVWRAIPAMVMVAILAVALFLSANVGTRPPRALGDETLLATSDAEFENVVFDDNRSLSSDEVLATILNDDEQEASK